VYTQYTAVTPSVAVRQVDYRRWFIIKFRATRCLLPSVHDVIAAVNRMLRGMFTVTCLILACERECGIARAVAGPDPANAN